MAKILNEEVEKKFEEMAVYKPVAVSGEKQTGDLLSYLSETLTNDSIMDFLKETDECLEVGYEEHSGCHDNILKLRACSFYIGSYKESGEMNYDEEISVREIPVKFPSLTAEEYKSRLNKSLESAIRSAENKYETLKKLFKKE